MKLNNFKNVTSLFIFLISSSLVHAAPVLIPTNVLLSSTSWAEGLTDTVSKTFNGGTGTFEVASSVDIVTFGNTFTNSANTSAAFDTTGLTISGNTDGGRYFRLPDGRETGFGGRTSATVSFTLASSGTIDFQWAASGRFSDVGGRASIINAAGDSFLFCSIGASCYNIDPFATDTFINLGDTGSIFLDSGEYTLSVNSFPVHSGPGVDVGGFGTLSLTGIAIVPVPATVWLFSSGLIGLLYAGRKMKFPHSA